MLALLKNEIKYSLKGLFIWAIAVGGMGLACILLYETMEDSMQSMADSMASLGSFADAFGMSKLSIATLKGFFATEVGNIHSLGSGMFAASIATVILSKEEDGHTAEYTFTLPVSRNKIIGLKFLSVLIQLVLFTVICAVLYVIGFVVLDAKEIYPEFAKFMSLQLMMNAEIAAICLLISALSKKNKLGIGISIAMVLYAYDLISKVVPKLADAAFLSPYSYANASTIFAKEKPEISALVLGIVCIIGFTTSAWLVYDRKDLAS